MAQSQFNGYEKLRFHRAWLEAYRKGEAVSPICVEMDMTNACNYGCPNCVWGDYITNNRTTVARSQALEQIRQIGAAGIKAIIFSGGGEPLLHPAIAECVEEARRCGLRVGLFSNGVYLTGKRATVLAASLDWVRIHLDAVSPEGYVRRHRRSIEDLTKVRENLAEFNAGNGKVDVGIGSVINPDTFSELPGLAQMAFETGCRFFQAKHDFDLLSRPEYISWWAETAVPALELLSGQYRSLGLGIQFTVADYNALPRSRKCHIHHLATAINAESDYSYCKRLRNTPAWVAGNLAEDSLTEILRGERNQQLSREVTPQNCGINCPYLGLNDLIDDYCEGRQDIPEPGDIPGKHVDFF